MFICTADEDSGLYCWRERFRPDKFKRVPDDKYLFSELPHYPRATIRVTAIALLLTRRDEMHNFSGNVFSVVISVHGQPFILRLFQTRVQLAVRRGVGKSFMSVSKLAIRSLDIPSILSGFAATRDQKCHVSWVAEKQSLRVGQRRVLRISEQVNSKGTLFPDKRSGISRGNLELMLNRFRSYTVWAEEILRDRCRAT